MTLRGETKMNFNNCKKHSKKTCSKCEHFGYCDKANICDGNCHKCDITDCENNPEYKEVNNNAN